MILDETEMPLGSVAPLTWGLQRLLRPHWGPGETHTGTMLLVPGTELSWGNAWTP